MTFRPKDDDVLGSSSSPTFFQMKLHRSGATTHVAQKYQNESKDAAGVSSHRIELDNELHTKG